MAALINIFPEIFTLSMICFILLVDVFIKQTNRSVTYLLAQITLAGIVILSYMQMGQPVSISFAGNFIRDDLSSVMKIFIAIATFVCFLFSRRYNAIRDLQKGEFYILMLFSLLGSMVLISGYSLITLYLGLELVSLPLYALIAMQRESVKATEAGMKYFILGALASGLLLYGMSIIYGLTGSLTINTIAAYLNSATTADLLIFAVSLIFIVTGLAFKLGAVPFHMWMPDVYEGAPTSIILFIGSVTKIAAFVMAVRLLAEMLPAMQTVWQPVLILIAFLSMALGNLLAIAQQNIKRLLAYSGIAHIGYMLLGFLTGTIAGYSAAMFYIVTYALVSLGAISLLILLSHKDFECEHINDLRGLNSRSPWLAFIMLLIMFSLAGIPPSVGFFAKVSILEALISIHLVWLAAAAMIFAVLGSYYYLRVVKVMYFDQPTTTMHVVEWQMSTRIAFAVNGFVILMLGLFPSALFNLCRNMF